MELSKEDSKQYNNAVMTTSIGDDGKGIYGKIFQMYIKSNCELIPYMYKAIEKIHTKHGKDTEVLLIYEDQPVNDFKSLFLTTHGMSENQEWCLKDIPNVYVSAVGTSFYQQTVPSNSVHIAFSHIACSWIPEVPITLSDSLTHATDNLTDEEQQAWVEHGSKCWEIFILNRAKELKPGGQLIIKTVIRNNEGYIYKRSHKNSACILEMYSNIWRKMFEENLITREEYINTNTPEYFGTIAELSKPFLDKESLFTKAGLSLLSVENTTLNFEWNSRWEKLDKSDEGQREEFFAVYEKLGRLLTSNMFYSGLSTKRSKKEKDLIVDEAHYRWINNLKEDLENKLNNLDDELLSAIFMIVKQ